jgi:hypothetical protein
LVEAEHDAFGELSQLVDAFRTDSFGEAIGEPYGRP